MYTDDKRIVITLDAGGSNLDFSAIKGNKVIAGPINKPSNGSHLDLCIATIMDGFTELIEQLDEKPVAISFAFPGPADYPNGIIGGFLPNFPSFRNGIALGKFLQKKFDVPVYINNDADLFTYGEALAGALPEVNRRLKEAGSDKVYRNLLGFTWGTGFGFGFTTNGQMHIGDNSCTEVFCLPNSKNPEMMAEEGVSIRALKRVYGELIRNENHQLEPVDIFNIAEGLREGDREAAKKAFAEFGEIAGDIMANAASLIDGIIVIGGGLTKAIKYIMPSLLKVMNGKINTYKGDTLNRLQTTVYDLDDEEQFPLFAKGESRQIAIYGCDETVTYDPRKRIGITVSKLGACQSVALGAYAFALHEIDLQGN